MEELKRYDFKTNYISKDEKSENELKKEITDFLEKNGIKNEVMIYIQLKNKKNIRIENQTYISQDGHFITNAILPEVAFGLFKESGYGKIKRIGE
jgi:hypothetical protein